ncbi:monocarboxylate transporter 4 [Fusarium sp. NRRL 25303]|nr:monocarboxylate transporter 4 [Fusarium sp. NRRL 25303]
MNFNNPNLFTDVDLLDGFISDDLTPYMSDSAPPPDLSDGIPNLAPTHPAPQNPFTPLSLHGYNQTATPAPPAKVGGRFTRESVRILKNWLATHQNHPYPREPERRMLQEETGLTKTQISNWLANARRRGKIPSSASSPRHGDTPAMDIPPRPGTPAVRNTSDMDPLQRWVDSPPEDEPAAVTAIARAVASVRPQSGKFDEACMSEANRIGSSSPYTRLSRTPSVRSVGTSRSSSISSVNSHTSRSSLGLNELFSRGSSRRRRRAYKEERRSLAAPRKAFQCTFCTETFRAKHDWSRHENSLHLPLERWVCSPEGPRGQKADSPEIRCVFCGYVDPDDAHIETHNYSACKNRPVQERTFNRKDHLNQHLKLVHNAKFAEWPMRQWKAPPPAIHSRCGFCNLVMETWIDRVHHLADHFKTGKTMADWKGDWGFEPHILELVENSIPPSYELLKLELAYFMQNHFYKHARMPTGDEMQLEACRILFASEPLSHVDLVCPSWLRDLVFSNVAISQQAQFGPMRSNAESRLSSLEISGKNNIFEGCPFETQLQEFVQAKQLLGLSIRDDELREECCRIVGRLEEVSATPSDFIANWLIKIIHLPGDWLLSFRQRTGIELIGLSEGMNLNAMIQDYTRLEQELGAYLDLQRVIGIEPPDDDLRRQARVIIHGSDSNVNHTAADDDYWLAAFRQRHSTTTENPEAWNTPLRPDPHLLAARGLVLKTSTAFLNDHNYWRWFTQELRRWVSAIMSPHNPASRVPSDEEIQHYARWISYNDPNGIMSTGFKARLVGAEPRYTSPKIVSFSPEGPDSLGARPRLVAVSMGILQIQLGDNEYFVPPTVAWRLNSWNASADADEFTPLTVVELNQTANVERVSSALGEYEKDDVWIKEFTQTLYIKSDKELAFKSSKYNVSAVYTGQKSVPAGPYFVHRYTGNVFQAYRLYVDTNQAFIQSTYQDPSGTHHPLRAGALSAGGLTIAVPSRLYFTPTKKRPLAGLRLSVKDLYDLKGVKTSGGNRALYEMSKVKTKTALCVQKLIDAGAVVVGKNKMSEFAFAGPSFTEHIDYLLPFNPRGDGYNSPGDSSGGSAAAVASYGWLDASMGSDTGGSIRGPALQNAVHGNRPTQDAVNLTGALPLSSAMDTSGIIARDPAILSKFTRSLYAGTIKEYSGLPSEVLLDSGSEQFLVNLEKDSPKAADAVGEFLNSLASLLSANGSVFSIDSAWTNSTPKVFSDVALSNIVGDVYINLTSYEQWNEFGKDYVEKYKSLHDGAFPHMVPGIREGWMNANKTMTQLTHEDDLASKKGVEEWVASEFLTADNKSCSNAVYVYLSASYPSYKPDVSQDGSNPYIRELLQASSEQQTLITQLNTTVNCNSTLGTEDACEESLEAEKEAEKEESNSGSQTVYAGRLASVAGLPDYAVSLGMFDLGQFSNSSLQNELVPVGANIMAAKGCDFVILDIIEALHKEGVIKTAKTGKTS